MEIKTYRAGTMHEALMLVRRDLGPDAAVLHTREVRVRRWFGCLPGTREIEVTASTEVHVPSRLPQPGAAEQALAPVEPPEGDTATHPRPFPPPPTSTPKSTSSTSTPMPMSPNPPSMPASSPDVQGQLSDLHAMLQDLCRRSHESGEAELPESLFRLFTDLIEADLNEELARELVERVRADAHGAELADPLLLKARVARMIEEDIPVTGPIHVTPGKGHVVALVGPTGVGKTTTIAKLAAIHRLKEKRKVGLITVDTYRIAAVEQLRTYADIIDLPMQVVSTPREMREAVRRLEGLDLILMDTAGRSPRDEIKIQELKTFISEAGADEVHLVLSSVAATRTLDLTAERFASVGTTSLLFTKLDEATGLGNLLPVIRKSGLPLSYLTNGQNVPDDIETAKPARLARLLLAMEDIFDSPLVTKK